MPLPLEIELEDPPKTRLEALRRRVRDRWRGFWLDMKYGPPERKPTDADWEGPWRRPGL